MVWEVRNLETEEIPGDNKIRWQGKAAVVEKGKMQLF